MDTENLDVRIKKKAIVELAEIGFSLSVIASILNLKYNIVERALTNELEIYNSLNIDFSVKTPEKKCPYSVMSQLKSYQDIYEITIFYTLYSAINPLCSDEEQPNPYAVALAYHMYICTARDRGVIPVFSHINQAYNLVNHIIQGLITVEHCSACGRMYVYPENFGGLECPLCRLKNLS